MDALCCRCAVRLGGAPAKPAEARQKQSRFDREKFSRRGRRGHVRGQISRSIGGRAKRASSAERPRRCAVQDARSEGRIFRKNALSQTAPKQPAPTGSLAGNDTFLLRSSQKNPPTGADEPVLIGPVQKTDIKPFDKVLADDYHVKNESFHQKEENISSPSIYIGEDITQGLDHSDVRLIRIFLVSKGYYDALRYARGTGQYDRHLDALVHHYAAENGREITGDTAEDLWRGLGITAAEAQKIRRGNSSGSLIDVYSDAVKQAQTDYQKKVRDSIVTALLRYRSDVENVGRLSEDFADDIDRAIRYYVTGEYQPLSASCHMEVSVTPAWRDERNAALGDVAWKGGIALSHFNPLLNMALSLIDSGIQEDDGAEFKKWAGEEAASYAASQLKELVDSAASNFLLKGIGIGGIAKDVKAFAGAFHKYESLVYSNDLIVSFYFRGQKHPNWGYLIHNNEIINLSPADVAEYDLPDEYADNERWELVGIQTNYPKLLSNGRILPR